MNYTVCDALGRSTTGDRGVWEAGEIISVILDTENNKALIQNAATLTRDEQLSVATAGLYGLGADAVPDDVFSAVFRRFNEMKLRPANNAELGPYDIDEANFVCDGNAEGYQKYVELLGRQNSFTGSNHYYDFKQRPWVTNGQYSYACESKAPWDSDISGYHPCHKAYRLNHVTKQAELLCDISAHAGSDSYGKEFDRIFAVDDNYVYFGRNDRYDRSNDEFDVTLMKFDHNGNLVASKSYVYSSSQMQQWNGSMGFSGSDYYPITHPGTPDYSGLYQTKNYIVVMLAGTSTSTGGSKHIQYRLINKNTLAITSLANGSYASYQYGTRFAVYDRDLFYILGHYAAVGKSDAYSTLAYNLASPKNALNGTRMYESLSCTVAGVSRYAAGVEGQLNSCNGYSYYLMKFCSDAYVKENISYAVVRSDAFDGSTGSFSTAYSLATIPDFGENYYDPVEDKFHHNGLDYEVYPSYVPPVEVVEVHKKFTAAPFFRTSGHLYFLRNRDNRVYKMEDKLRYVIDHVEVRE